MPVMQTSFSLQMASLLHPASNIKVSIYLLILWMNSSVTRTNLLVSH